jgi:hypothetical protein
MLENCPQCKQIQDKWNSSLKSIGNEYPDGVFYRSACKVMGIDPDNNPNYKCDKCKEAITEC